MANYDCFGWQTVFSNIKKNVGKIGGAYIYRVTFDHVCPDDLRQQIATFVCIQFVVIIHYSCKWFIFGLSVSNVWARNAVITAYNW